ncbi:MAG: response regulator [Candidatus Acidiferrales bacterium]
MADVVALVDDIFFQAKMFETAKQLGVELRTCTTPDALAEEIAKQAPKLAIVDLNAHSDPLQAIARVRAASAELPLIAYLSHVQVDLARQARDAGCHEVMPRSQFTKNLATILSKTKSQS